jgi:hypothetical protein
MSQRHPTPSPIKNIHDLRTAKQLAQQRLVHLEQEMGHHQRHLGQDLSVGSLSMELVQWITAQFRSSEATAPKALHEPANDGTSDSQVIAQSDTQGDSWLTHLMPVLLGAITAGIQAFYESTQSKEPEESSAVVSRSDG